MKLPINEIKKLYYRDGLSTSEIAKLKGFTVWQVINFMRKNGLPRRGLAENNRLSFLKQKPSFNLKRTLTNEEERLKLAALMLYWAEGVKGGKECTVDFVNSDPKMILIFLKFLRNVCGVDERKLRVLLYCYANQDIDQLIEYWSSLMLIPKSQFQKPYIRQNFNPNGRRMLYGLVHIRYNDKKLFLQIIQWTDLYKDM